MTPEFVSFVAGAWLLAVCIPVMWEYWPRKWWRLEPFELLTLGIFLGFFAGAMNTLWWQILNTMNATYGWFPPDQFTEWGRYGDIVFKGGAAMAGMIHLRAKRKMRDASR